MKVKTGGVSPAVHRDASENKGALSEHMAHP